MAVQPPLSLHRRIQQLLLGFSRGISATLSVSTALDALSAEVNALLGTRRVSIWIHNRRARELAFASSSDRNHASAGTRVQTESDTIPARGLRLDAPQFTPAAPGEPRMLVAPLRGWRRALGTVIIEGEPDGLGDAPLVDAVQDLALQLSFVLENVQTFADRFRSVETQCADIDLAVGG